MGVDVGCVEIVDAGVQRAMHHGLAFTLIAVAKVAKHAGAETQFADRYAGSAQYPHFHEA